jgi:tetratricopeptide (TPR) repeat protein
MYSRGFFDQAMKCFERSGHKDLFKKAEANKNADDATKKLIEIESERNSIKQGAHFYKEMNTSDISKIKKKLKKEEADAVRKFTHGGSIFEELLMFKQAGQCYFSGKIFEKAFECFCKAFMNKQAAESLEMMNRYREAAEYYEKEEGYLKVIECLDLVNEWTLIL